MCALFARERALLEGFPRFRGYIASKQLFVRGGGGGGGKRWPYFRGVLKEKFHCAPICTAVETE